MMRIVAVDDEQLSLEKLVETIKKVIPDAEVAAFNRASKVLVYVEENPCDIVFMDIEMPGMKGIDLAKYLKEISPRINIVFVTAYSDYKADAMDLRASGYIEKPVSAEKIKEELDNLRYSVYPSHEALLHVQCFGHFDVFDSEGNPVHFGRNKAKELFAYLVSRAGARCTTRELIGVLFENDPYSLKTRNYFQKIVSDMMKTLKSIHAEQAVFHEYQNYAVDISKLDCDYYRFRNMEAAAVNKYTGEFMAQYSWAEFYTGYIESHM